jgi:hypothetical protein
MVEEVASECRWDGEWREILNLATKVMLGKVEERAKGKVKTEANLFLLLILFRTRTNGSGTCICITKDIW